MSEIYLYSHSTRSLVQKPGMEKPDCWEWSRDMTGTTVCKKCEAYEQHLAQLKNYPCSWLDEKNDGDVLELGKDFTIQSDFRPDLIHCHPQLETAIPIPKEAPVENNPERTFSLRELLDTWSCAEKFGHDCGIKGYSNFPNRSNYFKDTFGIKI